MVGFLKLSLCLIFIRNKADGGYLGIESVPDCRSGTNDLISRKGYRNKELRCQYSRVFSHQRSS